MRTINTPLTLLLTGLLATLLLACSAPTHAAAADTDELPPAEDLQALVDTLEDDARRKALITNLRTLISANERQARAELDALSPGARLVQALATPARKFGQVMSTTARDLAELPGWVASVPGHLSEPDNRSVLLEVLFKVLAALLIGMAVEALLRRPLAARGNPDAATVTFGERFVALIIRIVLEIVLIGAFAVAAYGVLLVLDPQPVTRFIALAAINASVIVRVALAVVRLTLAPRNPGARPFPSLPDDTAAYLYVWARRLVGLPIYTYFALEAALLLGMPLALHDLGMQLLGLYVLVLLVTLIMQSRMPVISWLQGESDASSVTGPVRNRVASLWHIFAIVYVLGAYVVISSGGLANTLHVVRATVLSLVIIVALRLVATLLRRLIGAMMRAPADLRERYPTLDARLGAYQSIAGRISTALLILVGTALILEAWSVDVGGLLASDTGQWLLAQSLTLVLIVVGVLIAWETSSVLIESFLDTRDTNGQVLERSARLRTLLPLFMNTLRVVLGVMLVLMVVSQLGVDIAPLLAGAGVLGLAIGFGAQSLARDVTTGTFILLEDTITVGDVITLGSHTGTVEKMSIRTISLRDLAGAVHTIPYGDVATVLNMTKDFSFATLEVGVAYRESYDEVIAILCQVAQDMTADAAWGANLTGELEVQGLDSFGASSVNIRVRIRTVPGSQWKVRRELNRRIKMAFDAAGIEIPFPHQTLYFGTDRNGNAPAARVLLENPTLPGRQAADHDAATPALPSGGRTGDGDG